MRGNDAYLALPDGIDGPGLPRVRGNDMVGWIYSLPAEAGIQLYYPA